MICTEKIPKLSVIHPRICSYLLRYPLNKKFGKTFCAVGLWLGEIKIYDTFLHSIMNIHTNTHGTECLLYMSKKKILINGSFEGKIQLYSMKTYKLIHVFYNDEEEISLIQKINNNIFVTGGMKTDIKIWNIDEKICVNIIQGKVLAVVYQS